MNLIRLVIIGLIVWLLYRMFLRLFSAPASTEQKPRKLSSHDMVKCAHCGIHIPASEALEQDGKHYCSPEHRDADQQQHHEGDDGQAHCPVSGRSTTSSSVT